MDVGLVAERIAIVGPHIDAAGAEVIEASGLAVAPGFIDAHTHDDFAVVLHPEMGFKVQGGVTSVVVGNCGFGAAPADQARSLAQSLHPGRELPRWQGYDGFLAYLEREPASCNVAALVGHGTVRSAVLNLERRAPSSTELDAMRALVREGVYAGCVGLSTGLIYEPGKHARVDEIVALAAEFAATGGLYATHMRDEGLRLLESVAEAIEIGERAGVAVQISHHKASGRASWGKVRDSLRLIEEARARGIDVLADQYPYTAGSTVLAAVVEYLKSEASGLGHGDPSEVVIASSAGHPEWEGRSLVEIAAELGVSPLDAAQRILDATHGSTTVVLHSMHEDDVQAVLKHSSTMIGSDGLPTLHGKPHPRLYGTFARVLGRYARDLGLLTMAEAVHRMTGMPARRFGLSGRGEIRPGAFADLVIFDPGRIADVATFEEPHRPPAGIAHVFVNGVETVRQGEHTGARAGRTLRHGASSGTSTTRDTHEA
jgi:N-acyl-D-aspartate/D-glutamate deacylase